MSYGLSQITGIRKNSRFKKAFKALSVLIAAIAILGFFILPPIAKSLIIKQLSETLNRSVSVNSLKINPFMLSTTIRGFEIKDNQSSDPFISFEELYMNIQTMSIFKRGFIIKEFRLIKPRLNIVRNKDLSYNFSDILNQFQKKSENEKKISAPQDSLRFSINNIQITGAAIDFTDGPKNTTHRVRDASLSIPFISNLPYYVESHVKPYFSALINDHHLSLTGNTKPFANSLETSIDITLKNFDIPYYVAYLPYKLDFRIASGNLDMQFNLSYVQYKDKSPSISIKGKSSLENFVLKDIHGGLLLNLPHTDVAVRSLELMSLKAQLEKIELRSPEINANFDKQGKLNLLSLIPPKNSSPAKPAKEANIAAKTASRPIISADEIIASNGKILFKDISSNPVFRTNIENINFKITNFSTENDVKANAELSFNTDTKEEFKAISIFSVEPLKAEGSAELKNITLKKYSPYYGKFLLFRIEDGKFNLSSKYSFAGIDQKPDIKLHDLIFNLSSLKIQNMAEKEELISIPSLTIKETSADLTKKELYFGDIHTQKGNVVVNRTKDGNINLSNLMPITPASSENGNAETNTAKDHKPWNITVKKFSIDKYSLKALDHMPYEPATISIDQIKFRGENISTKKNTKGKISLQLNMGKTASLGASGNISIEPLHAQLKIKTQNIPLMPALPYFSDRLKIIILDGGFSSDGTLSASYNKNNGPRLSYKGTASVNNFASIDKAEAEDFLKWNSLYFDAMDISYSPMTVNIGEVAMTDFYARIIINEDGSINLQNILEKAETPKEDVKTTTEKTQQIDRNNKITNTAQTSGEIIKIEKVTLQGGALNFSDQYIKPNFGANMLEIGGRISGLSSEDIKMADVEMRGKLDNYAPLEITGKINPLRDDLFIDLKISFKDMDMSPLTPYSGRYLGYVIEKGKLALNLHYLIEKKKIDAQNKILLDQFTLGNQVDSPEATKLPVKLAIALLKNRSGLIDIDVPVSGQIDDPKFSIGKIVIKMLLNLLVKAATSPFALLGALFGGGEELSYVEFDAGVNNINENGYKKINTLINALHDRPSLKIDMEGHVDMEKDREGLKQLIFNKKIKAQKFKEAAAKSAEASNVDEIKIEPAEYPKYLKAAYKEEKFPKPRNILGIAKDLPVAEMEKLMLTNIEITDSDLRLLASQRAMAIKNYVMQSKKVEQERIFLVEPKSLQPDKKNNVKNSRVDFRLK